MKWLGKIGMTLALTMLMLHTVMPHSHHDQLDNETVFVACEKPTNMLDYVRHAFHLDPGQNHLTDYQITKQLIHVHVAAILPDILAFPAPKFDLQNKKVATQFGYVIFPPPSDGWYELRGPPMIG